MFNTLSTTFDYARSSSMRGHLVMHQCLHHVYIHDVNIDASQDDRALN